MSYHIPMTDSLVAVEKRPLTLVKELFKYLTRGKGLLLSPVLETCLFARSDLLNTDGHLKADELQLNASDPANLPDIEIIPVIFSLSFPSNCF